MQICIGTAFPWEARAHLYRLQLCLLLCLCQDSFQTLLFHFHCTALMIPEASIMQPSFVIGPISKTLRIRFRSCLDGPWRHPSRNVSRSFFLSPTTAIFAACYPGGASPSTLHFPSAFVTLLVSIFTIGFRNCFLECLSIDDIIFIYQQVFADLVSSCFCFPIAVIGVPPGVRPRRSCFTTFASVR